MPDLSETAAPFPTVKRAVETDRDVVIVASGLSKRFRIPAHRPSTLKERVLHPFRKIAGDEIAAADAIDFTVKRGEFFGIVGPNGSGKSTLLKMLAGIYRPDAGELQVHGRVSPFIELGVGFNMELTARDNVLINGTLLGVKRAEMADRYPGILRFAGLEQFEDLKLKNYSSGMLARLAFSTAIQVDAEILLLDEVLAVGDASFQQKCFDSFRRLQAEGRTIVLVTHAMDAVRRFCDRAMMVQDGRIVRIGDPELVSQAYREVTGHEGDEPPPGGPPADPGAPGPDGERMGDGSAHALAAWLENGAGERIAEAPQGEPLTMCAEFEFPRGADRPVLGIQLKNEHGADVIAINTLWSGTETPVFSPGERAVLRIAIEAKLGVGAYTLTPGVASRDGTNIADWRLGLAGFLITGGRWTGASVEVPHRISVERAP